MQDIDEEEPAKVEEVLEVGKLDLQYSDEVLSMQDIDEEEPAKVEEVLEVGTTAKLMTEVVTTAEPTTTTAEVPKASAPKRRRGVIIQDLKETAASVIVHTEGILLETAELNGIKTVKEEMEGTMETKLETIVANLHLRIIQKLWLPLMERLLTGLDMLRKTLRTLL
nr:hypothetical protein [Tanacetum cinerariifolium]